MKQTKTSTTNKSGTNKGSQSGNANQKPNSSIDTCTMDPCPMKTKSKTKQEAKCPKCGMED